MATPFEKELPTAHRGATRVVYSTCGGLTEIHAAVYRGEHWWRLSSPQQPDRWLRLYNPSSLKLLVDHYGFVDGRGCVNRSRGSSHFDQPIKVDAAYTLDALSDAQRAILGVPQRAINSGLCWYCAVCFILFFSKQMRELIMKRAPRALRLLCDDVLMNKDRAEDLRRHLYETYALGDKPGQPPEQDGQNGCTQMSILLGRLDIPLIRLLAPTMYELLDPVTDQRGQKVNIRVDPRPSETALLVVRCFRTKWRPRRRITRKGRRYKLVGMLIGSEHCGHQIAASTCDMRVCRWALSDSDMSQHGIGPMFWSILQSRSESREAFKARWVNMWDTMIPLTLFGRNEVCDLNPVNRATHELEKYARTLNHSTTPGVVNTDYIYMSFPSAR